MPHWSLPLHLGLSAFLLVGSAFSVRSETLMPLPAPEGEVVLRISGDISVSNAVGEAMFDLAMLKALGPIDVTTSTLWTDGEQVFTGVPLRTVLDRIGAKGTMIDARALNDYRVDIPVSDALADGPILAYAQNGVPLTVRDMGPIWVIYPYDADVAYQNEIIYSRSIWQLQRMILLP